MTTRWLRTAPLFSSAIAVLAALAIGALFLAVDGKDWQTAYGVLFERGLADRDGLGETFKKMAPLLIVGGGLLVALRSSIWNIGIDGQFMIGALSAAVVAPHLVGQVPDPLMWLLAGVAGFLGGMAWALVPALLRTRFGLNEIITTLMMSYVAFNLTAWLVKGPVHDDSVVAPQTAQVPLEHRLPDIPGTGVHIGLLVGLLVVLLTWVLFRFTVPGFMLDVMGKSRRAAIHAGFPVAGLTIGALLASGAMAGLAGANDVLGVQGLFKANWNPAYGFTAFALVYLARLKPAMLLPFAFLLAFLQVGGEAMPRKADIPTYFVEMLEGLMLLCFAVTVWLERRWLRDDAPLDRIEDEEVAA